MGTEAVNSDPRPQRHEAKKAAIVEEAWALAREQGLAGLSLHALASRVGMRQPSLYVYFASKSDLYDNLFAQGNQQLLAWMDGFELPADAAEAVKAFSRGLMHFFVEDPTRYELLYERTLPGFVPSLESYALAQRAYDRFVHSVLEPAGIRTPEHVDVYVSLMAGLAGAQLSNDPGGNRWARHVEWVVDMLLRRIVEENGGRS